MSKILILYGTTDGHTRKIALAMEEAIRLEGGDVDLLDARYVVSAVRPEPYDGAIVLASVHAGGYQAGVKHWVRANADALNRMPSAFISVCLGILEQKPEPQKEVHDIMNHFLESHGWKPTVRKIVAGALPYTRYNWFKRWIMKRIVTKTGGDTDTSRDYEYTDWDDVRAFARHFAKTVSEVIVPVMK